MARATNNGFGYHTIAKKQQSFLTQRGWRITGGVALLVAGGMAWYGPTQLAEGQSVGYLAGYWGIFLVALAVAMWCVMLDLRYIRYEYAEGERDIFQQTLGNEEFRRAIAEAQREEAELKARESQDPPPQA